MRLLALSSTLVVTLLTARAQADEWWGRDKSLHFGVSMGLAASGYALSAPFTEHRGVRAAVGATGSLLLGAGKEAYDAVGHGDPSWKDFAWDVAGTAVGTLLAYAVDELFFNESSKDRTTTTAEGAMVVVRF